MGFTYDKAQGKFIVNQPTLRKSRGIWRGGFLHLQLSIISLPISKMEIDGYKVPSTYTTKFSLSALWMITICDFHQNFVT
jgi:hypothetical protein